MQLMWTPVEKANGPKVQYTVHRLTPAFNSPPPLVTAGTRFPGNGYYKFLPQTIPQGVAFSGWASFLNLQSLCQCCGLKLLVSAFTTGLFLNTLQGLICGLRLWSKMA